jgi:selenocysteine lyase/cysteine desulfurase
VDVFAVLPDHVVHCGGVPRLGIGRLLLGEVDAKFVLRCCHQKLDKLNFVLSRYGRIIRVAPHFFNEQAEINQLLEALQGAA